MIFKFQTPQKAKYSNPCHIVFFGIHISGPLDPGLEKPVQTQPRAPYFPSPASLIT